MFLALVHLPEILIGIGAALTWLFYYPWHRAMHDYRVKLAGRCKTFSGMYLDLCAADISDSNIFLHLFTSTRALP